MIMRGRRKTIASGEATISHWVLGAKPAPDVTELPITELVPAPPIEVVSIPKRRHNARLVVLGVLETLAIMFVWLKMMGLL